MNLLPANLGHLLTEGVTPLGRGADGWPVVIRERRDQDGQWVGTYSRSDGYTVAKSIATATGGEVTAAHFRGWAVTLPARMTGPEFRAIREQVGYSIEDVARDLSKSRSIVQKWEAGQKPIPAGVAMIMETIQDKYADDRDHALSSKPAELLVWPASMDEDSWEQTARPSRWWRMIAAECRQDHGTRIIYRTPE